jgi:hypothetical protein
VLQYRGLKDYVRNQKAKRYLDGKERFILRGDTAYLKRLHADRRSKSLGLTEFAPYDERGCEPDEQMQVGFLAFDRTVGLFI